MLMNASSRGSDPSSVFRPRLSQQAIKLLAAEILRAENLSCAAGKTDRYDLVRRAAVNARKTNRTAPNCRLRNSACSGVGYMRIWWRGASATRLRPERLSFPMPEGKGCRRLPLNSWSMARVSQHVNKQHPSPQRS